MSIDSPVYRLALGVHLVAGTLALLAFWGAALLRKGSRPHRLTGRVYLLGMLGVILSGPPLVFALLERGQPVSAGFLGYLLVLVSTSCWSAWRAIRDRGDRQRYFGGMLWSLHGLSAASGLAMVIAGVGIGSPLLAVFGSIGVVGLIGTLRAWRRAPATPNWWLREHYGAMVGNGVATHIAFFSIGLRNAFPGVDPLIVTNLAWFLPLVASLLAGVYLNRRYGRPPATRATPPYGQRLPA